MPVRRAAAVEKINEHFNALATKEVHRDQAHAAKRTAAATLLAGGAAPAWFTAEAEMRGVSTIAFAIDVAGKPDNAAERELKRQQLMLAIAAATTPDEIPTP
jgi:hypothetical protein